MSVASATENIVVTANRLETPESEIASSITVISKEEIERKQSKQVSDVLRDVPGLSVVNAGGPGKATSVSIRGTDSAHTLVMVDGVEMNDPLNPSGGFDFGNLSAQDIERIEIIRGSQSVLYGSAAIGGVIQIITKKGSGPLKANIEGVYGTYNSYRLQGGVRGGLGSLNYFFGAGQQRTDGFPSADKTLGNIVNNGQFVTTLTGNLGVKITPKTTLDWVNRYSDANFSLPATGGPPGYDAVGARTGDDPGFLGTDRQGYSKLQLNSVLTDIWESRLALNYSFSHRTSDHLPNSVNSLESHSAYDSNRIRGLFQNNFDLSDNHTLTIGIDSVSENGTSTVFEPVGTLDSGLKNKSDNVTGVFVQDQWHTSQATGQPEDLPLGKFSHPALGLLAGGFFGTWGARYDSHRELGSQVTYRVAPGYKFAITKTTLRGTIGTGFKIPSLFQRFSSYGSMSVQPERSISYDCGFDQEIGGPSTKLGVTYFRTNFDQLIGFDFATSHYGNTGRAHSQGMELGVGSTAIQDLILNISYTYTWAVDDVTGLPLLRRSKHQLTGDLTYLISDRTQAGLQARYMGARDDLDAVTRSRLQMPDFAIFNLTTQYRLNDHFRTFGKIENLLDSAYEEINGYGTPGRSMFVGLGYDI